MADVEDYELPHWLFDFPGPKEELVGGFGPEIDFNVITTAFSDRCGDLTWHIGAKHANALTASPSRHDDVEDGLIWIPLIDHSDLGSPEASVLTWPLFQFLDACHERLDQ